MITKYYIKENYIFCDFLNKNITMTTKFSNISEITKPIEKRCSEWENCKNREYCKYGKI
mgnify:CR=1 FL=1